MEFSIEIIDLGLQDISIVLIKDFVETKETSGLAISSQICLTSLWQKKYFHLINWFQFIFLISSANVMLSVSIVLSVPSNTRDGRKNIIFSLDDSQ